MKFLFSFLISLLLSPNLIAQKQKITLTDIWASGKFYPKTIKDIHSMQDGIHYTVLEEKGIVEYSYANGQETAVLIPGRFQGYIFSKDEKQILVETDKELIYRHSKRAVYNVYNVEKKTFTPIFKAKKIQEPAFSPDSRKVAFVYENNLYYQDLLTNKITQITSDGKKNNIINGITDWVYEEEFSFVRAFDWNADSSVIAFIRFDESKVKQVTLPLYESGNNYPKLISYKYPKAGEENAKVSVHYYNLNTQKTQNVYLDNYQDFYVPKISFNPNNADDLFIFISNRHQNNVYVLKEDIKSNSHKTLFTEADAKYIETDNLTFDITPKGIIWASEREGFRQLYLIDYDTGKIKNKITKGAWEVTDFYGSYQGKVYYQSTKEGAVNRSVYSCNITGDNEQKLSQRKGWNDAEFSANFHYFINTWTDANTPQYITLNHGKDGKEIRVLEDSHSLNEALTQYDISPKKFFTFITSNGDKLNAWMITPSNMIKGKKYPVLMYAYGGPGVQTVMNRWGWSNYFWFQSLAEQGYIVVSVDNRGTGGRGADFKKVTYKNLGKYEFEDQMLSAKYLQNLPYIDAQRIGMFGWSFGGYMTSLAMTKGADIFRAGIAVAPVTNWRFYDSVYTERFLQTPQENPRGYDDNSPIYFVNQLKGKYLIIHGSADDNVHLQNTMQMTEALTQAGKNFDMQIYTDKNHGIYGGYTRLNLYRKMTNFLLKNL